MEDLKRNDLVTSDDGMAECTIPDSELADVSGGIYVGQYAYVSGPVYLTRYAEEASSEEASTAISTSSSTIAATRRLPVSAPTE